MKRKSPRTESAALADAGEGGEIFAQQPPPHARIRERFHHRSHECRLLYTGFVHPLQELLPAEKPLLHVIMAIDNHVPVYFLRVVGKRVHPVDAYFVKNDEIKAR